MSTDRDKRSDQLSHGENLFAASVMTSSSKQRLIVPKKETAVVNLTNKGRTFVSE